MCTRMANSGGLMGEKKEKVRNQDWKKNEFP